ncbi:phosphatidate phosphatase LPIN2-like [Clytia hemisphaerica]
MYYIGNLVKSVTGVYNQINSATLTGAIDIVVVKQADGTFIGSPFHVRFGKLGVLSSTEKVVEISINDEEVDIQMKLGQAGEAFFVEKIASSPDGDIVPYNLATSPIPSSTFLTDEQFNFKKVQRRDDMMETETNFPENPVILPEIVEHKAKTKDDNTSLSRTFSEPISIKKAQNSIHLSPKQNRHAIQRISEMQSEYPLSDMDSPLSGSPPDDDSTRRIYSDTEVEGHLTLAKNTSLPEDKRQDPDMTWEWGMLPEGKIAVQKPPTKTPRGAHAHEKSGKKHHRKHRTKGGARPKMKVPSEGLLLDEVLGMEDKEVADLYFNRGNSLDDLVLDEDTIDARGESTPAVDAVKEKNPFSFNNTSPIKAKQQEDPEVTKEEDKMQEAGEKKSDEEVVINVEEMAIPSETSVGSKEEGDEKGDETLPLGDEVEEPKDIVLSLCGGLMSRRVVPEKFNDFVVSYDGFCQNPSVILSNPKLVIKINESYYNWAVAGPYLVSYMAYDKTLQPYNDWQDKYKGVFEKPTFPYDFPPSRYIHGINEFSN